MGDCRRHNWTASVCTTGGQLTEACIRGKVLCMSGLCRISTAVFLWRSFCQFQSRFFGGCGNIFRGHINVPFRQYIKCQQGCWYFSIINTLKAIWQLIAPNRSHYRHHPSSSLTKSATQMQVQKVTGNWVHKQFSMNIWYKVTCFNATHHCVGCRAK